MGALTGAFVTAILNSSSVTTVLVVGFITAGIMTLGQSIGVIMGANIGSTVTAQIVAFNVTQYAPLMITIGFGMLFISKREEVKHYGSMIMGLGLIFFGMGVMRLREDIQTVLEPNMVVSMEPMIIIPEGQPGAGGYREHDILVVTEDGAENITQFPFGPEHNIVKQ